jgi:hypothetical protein
MIVGLSCALCAACSFNGTGFVVADVTNTTTATVIRIRALGVQLRTRSDDAGATFGYSDHVYVLPRSVQIAAGRYWLDAPLPRNAESLSVVGFSVGLDMLARPPELDLSLGAAQHVLLVLVPADADIARSILLDVSHPDLTAVREFEGCFPC